MNLFSLGFVLLILVASGGIAFVADGLGKKIGKKRLSIAGLRPKHVASLGTILMGVTVSALTIGFIAAVNNDARTWLSKGNQLIKEIRSLEGENVRATDVNRDLRRKGDRLRLTNEGLGKQNVGLQAAIVRLQNSLLVEQSALDRERTALGAIRAERASLLAERNRLSGQVVSLKDQVADARRQYAATNALLAEAKRTLTSAKLALDHVRGDLRTARSNATTYQSDAQKALRLSFDTYQKNLSLAAEVANRQKEVERLQTETLARQKELEDAEAQVASAQKRYADVQSQLAEARQGLADLRSIAEGQQLFLASTTRSSRTEAMTFRKGEELARVVVPGGASPETTANLLASLLRTARTEAAARGAKAHRTNGEIFQAADIVDRQDPKTGERIEAEALKQALVASVANSVQDQVLVASSTLNAFVGESVSLDLAVMPNPLVYHRNDMVAETQIDGSQAEDRILAQLSEFVASRVRDRAVRDRMVPRLGTAAPFGEVPTSEVFNLVRDVKQRNRSVRVQAVADGDIRAADPLRLEFRVK